MAPSGRNYALTGVPKYVLVGRDGKVIAETLTVSEIRTSLEAALRALDGGAQ